MKLAWLNDYTPIENKGGSQQSQAELIRFGLETYRNLEIFPMTPATLDFNTIDDCDYIVLNNITLFDIEIINRIIRDYRYIKMDADYFVANNINKYNGIYNNSLINYFRSPLLFTEIIKKLKFVPSHKYMPSCINTDIFIDYKQKRISNSYYWVGNAVPEKGLVNVMNYIKERPKAKLYASILSTSPYSEQLRDFQKFVLAMPEMNNESLVEYYNMFENFIHLPEWKEPTGRAFMEAYLCGCNVIGNENIGWYSYTDWNFNNRNSIVKTLTRYKYDFWYDLFTL